MALSSVPWNSNGSTGLYLQLQHIFATDTYDYRTTNAGDDKETRWTSTPGSSFLHRRGVQMWHESLALFAYGERQEQMDHASLASTEK